MLLNNLLEISPRKAFIYLERSVNNESSFADVSDIYKGNGMGSFPLPYAFIDLQRLNCFGFNSGSQLPNNLKKDNQVKFFIHPEMLKDYQTKGLSDLVKLNGSILVAPTSSTRTVLVLEEEKPFMIKTDLERKLGDGIKKLKRAHIDHSVKIDQELKKTSLENFGYLSEPLGFSYLSGKDEVGVLFREFNASPQRKPGNYLIPFFSLCSLDRNHPEDPRLLLSILKNLNDKNSSIVDQCLEKIILPYVGSWFSLVSKNGLSMEMHAQNTLLEIDNEGKPTRVVYRDLQDTFVDAETRKRNSLPNIFSKNIIGQNERKYFVEGKLVEDASLCKQISYSLTYDYRIGRALDYFGSVLDSVDSKATKKLTTFVKRQWEREFSGTEFFPKKAYILDKKQEEMDRKLNFKTTEKRYR